MRLVRPVSGKAFGHPAQAGKETIFAIQLYTPYLRRTSLAFGGGLLVFDKLPRPFSR